jgi:glycosyltransferase involved in cell wall biosynthesis
LPACVPHARKCAYKLIGICLFRCVASEFAKFCFELFTVLVLRDSRRLISLSESQVAVVIPCHNSEAVILETLDSLPHQYTVYCVVNNCSDTTADAIRRYRGDGRDIRILEVTYQQRSKSRAVVVGAVAAKHEGFTHVLQIDDDVVWPAEVAAIPVYDLRSPVTALPVLPHASNTLIRGFQSLEYVSVHLNKTSQILFGKNVTWAAGAGAIFRCDSLLHVMQLHDGDFIGEDVQASYLHHFLGYNIDFVPTVVLYTQVPRNLSQWWRQRCQCWDISFMFYHADLLLKVLFLPVGRGPGAWIRIMTFYRLYDAVGVLVKCTLPVLLLVKPPLFLTFIVFSYVVLSIKLFVHRSAFGGGRLRGSGNLLIGYILYPFYEYLIWVSRLAALPEAASRFRRLREPLGTFGAHCLTHLDQLRRPYLDVRIDL